ncbi:MAG: hypothetical protein WA840_07600 [Caulobacteraceae bacterium]
MAEIGASPALYPIQDLRGEVRLIRLEEADYRRASFLDDRMGPGSVEGGTRSWLNLAEAVAGTPIHAHFIFHIGHVGSTLMSRLLGEHPAVFSLREPGLLRPLAHAWPQLSPAAEVRLDTLLRLLSRTWRPRQTALIKATSFVSVMAEELLTRDVQARAVAMATSPPSYMRSILGGPASRKEISGMTPHRMARLEERLETTVVASSEGEAIAMSWLCEALALHAACERHGSRVLWLDFDRFLTDPVRGLQDAFTHLDVPAEPAFVAELAAGPLMGRYSKDLEHAYDADLRRRVQAQAEDEFGGEVAAGMEWLQRMGEIHPPVLAALRRAAQAARGVRAPMSAVQGVSGPNGLI